MRLDRGWGSAISLGLCVLFGLDCAGTPARAENITGITVAGNQRIETSDVLHHLTLKAGGAYTRAEADRSIKDLYATGLFRDAAIAITGGRVRVTVAENPVVAAVALSGNVAIDTPALLAALTAKGGALKAGSPYTAAKALAGARAIRDLYRAKGRLTTAVTPKAETRADGRVDLTFQVTEGPVDKVSRIVFEGNTGLREKVLRDVLATSEAGWLDVLTGGGVYDPDKLEVDRAAILMAYRRHGYPDARVEAIDAVVNASGGAPGYTITYRIIEGPHYAFAAAPIETALAGVDANALQALNRIETGADYDAGKIDATTDALSLALAEHGQPFARVTPKLTRDPAGGTMAVAFQIDEGPRILIDRIAITGNTRTRDAVIRRELRLAEGDPWNARTAERDRLRVQKLGFFKSVAWQPSQGSAPDRISLSLQVVEQETAEIGFGIGVSSSEGVIGDIAWSENNFRGAGGQVRVKLAGSLTRLDAEAGFTEPHFLGTGASAGFDVFYKDADLTQLSSYQSQRVGGDLRLTTALSDTVTAGSSYTFTRNTLYNVSPTASLAIREAAGGAGSATYNTSAVGSSLSYDTRDNRKLPTSGVYLVTASDFAGVGGDVRFVRQTGEARIYYPLNDQVTLIGRATAGTIVGWGGQDVRLLDLFNKGEETVRGFAPAGIGPRDTLSANADALGGTTYASTSVEARFNLPLVPDDLKLRGAVFADAASLFGTTVTAAKLPGLAGAAPAVRAAVGTGLVWDSPLGPLQLGYAVPVLKQPFDKTQPLSFGLAGY